MLRKFLHCSFKEKSGTSECLCIVCAKMKTLQFRQRIPTGQQAEGSVLYTLHMNGLGGIQSQQNLTSK